MATTLGKTVGQLEEELDSAELSEWLAFAEIEPLPDPYWIGAQLCAVTANSFALKARHKTEDFLPRVVRKDRDSAEPEPADRPTPEQSQGSLGRLVGQAHRKVVRRKPRTEGRV